ncbi:Hydroxyacylglutathione hydrolase [wastewater metagenome]|uniref:hydroxyacylglutathione hydrolase n=3 Tax=root TaxID=1 RepID=A0A5B8RF93_9ZZZZ|nr:hydroxyacylglutathione hydrolase [Arhodomonas aquaeolei]QEA07530.1 hydroxyacylglutathione hydrolase [uncultured organism]
MTDVFAISAFSDNYIWALTRAGDDRAVVVDPGDAAPVRRALDERGLTLAGILITHHHPDHTGGVRELVAAAGADIPVWGPADERIPGRTVALADGDAVTLPGFGITFEVIACPGHTAGHIAYYGDGMLFCGDTLFAGGCGRLFEGTPEQMHASLARFTALPGETRVYCAHEYTQANLTFAAEVEPDNTGLLQRLTAVREARAHDRITLPSTIAEELATNPFLRTDAPTVRKRAATRAGHALADGVAVFAAVRAWKDAF